MKITIADVAREAGVSSQTVSRVINNKGEIRPETRQQVMAVIERLGYRPSSIARSLATNRTRTLGLSVSDIANPFWSEIARGVEDVAWERGYHLFLCSTTEAPQREQAVIQLLEEKRTDGIIIAGSRLSDEQLIPLIRRHPAAVLLNRSLPDNLAGTLRVDSFNGAVQAVNHLVNGGRRRIAFLGGPIQTENSRMHRAGFTAALETAGYSVDPALLLGCAPFIEDGYTGATTLLSAHPDVDALYCYNDLIAIGASQACADLQRRVPEDIAIVGYDDILLARLVTPSLTTLSISKYDFGVAAAQMLFARMEGQLEPSEIIITPTLVVRASAP